MNQMRREVLDGSGSRSMDRGQACLEWSELQLARMPAGRRFYAVTPQIFFILVLFKKIKK
jgi:hypothetical protein